MKVDVSKLSLNDLVELRDKINGFIWEYSDGHVYICKVRSYGRNWEEKGIKNVKTLQNLCYEYNGEDGIVDIYTTNTDLGDDFYNYGDTKVIKSLEDYEKRYKYNSLVNTIKQAEQELVEYVEDQDVNFYQRRSHFKPYYTQEHIDEMKEKLKNLPMDFEPPYNYFTRDDE